MPDRLRRFPCGDQYFKRFVIMWRSAPRLASSAAARQAAQATGMSTPIGSWSAARKLHLPRRRVFAHLFGTLTPGACPEYWFRPQDIRNLRHLEATPCTANAYLTATPDSASTETRSDIRFQCHVGPRRRLILPARSADRSSFGLIRAFMLARHMAPPDLGTAQPHQKQSRTSETITHEKGRRKPHRPPKARIVLDQSSVRTSESPSLESNSSP